MTNCMYIIYSNYTYLIKVFNENGTCNYLNTEPSNFTNPLIARFVRVIPIKWVGASVCLRMELHGWTIKGAHQLRNY